MNLTDFEIICKENYARIYKYILGMVNSIECAEDLTQEVFLIAYKKGTEFSNHEKPIAFLYKTAKNLTLEYFRSSRKEILIAPEAQIAGEQDDVSDEICKRYDSIIDETEYEGKVLLTLSENNQILYEKYYLEHRTMHDIAKELGISDVALRMKYVRLRKEVRSIVKKLELNVF